MNESALHFQLIQHISEQMVMAKLNEIEPYHLCFWTEDIEVHNFRHTYRVHPVFWTFTGKQTHAGCSQAELIKTTNNIMHFLKENPECLKQFKP